MEFFLFICAYYLLNLNLTKKKFPKMTFTNLLKIGQNLGQRQKETHNRWYNKPYNVMCVSRLKLHLESINFEFCSKTCLIGKSASFSWQTCDNNTSSDEWSSTIPAIHSMQNNVLCQRSEESVNFCNFFWPKRHLARNDTGQQYRS